MKTTRVVYSLLVSSCVFFMDYAAAYSLLNREWIVSAVVLIVNVAAFDGLVNRWRTKWKTDHTSYAAKETSSQPESEASSSS